MNRQTFNLFLIALLALTIIVDAHNHDHNHNHNHNHKTCTITETGSHTVTVTKKCKHEPTHISCHVRNDMRRHNHDNDRDHCKATKTITCTPTTTKCSEPTPKCCESPGGPGFQNQFHSSFESTFLDGITNDIDCCKACLANPDCLQWTFLQGICVIHTQGLSDTCSSVLINSTGTGISSGIIRCSGDSGNCLS